MRHQIVPGNKDSAEITGLEGGVSYSVRVTALVGDREGAPVSIVVTTRRRMLGLEGVLNWGLCSRDGAYGETVCAGVGEGSRIYSKPVCVGKVWGRKRIQCGRSSLAGRASLIVMLSLKRLRSQHLWRPFR